MGLLVLLYQTSKRPPELGTGRDARPCHIGGNRNRYARVNCHNDAPVLLLGPACANRCQVPPSVPASSNGAGVWRALLLCL